MFWVFRIGMEGECWIAMTCNLGYDQVCNYAWLLLVPTTTWSVTHSFLAYTFLLLFTLFYSPIAWQRFELGLEGSRLAFSHLRYMQCMAKHKQHVDYIYTPGEVRIPPHNPLGLLFRNGWTIVVRWRHCVGDREEERPQKPSTHVGNIRLENSSSWKETKKMRRKINKIKTPVKKIKWKYKIVIFFRDEK